MTWCRPDATNQGPRSCININTWTGSEVSNSVVFKSRKVFQQLSRSFLLCSRTRPDPVSLLFWHPVQDLIAILPYLFRACLQLVSRQPFPDEGKHPSVAAPECAAMSPFMYIAASRVPSSSPFSSPHRPKQFSSLLSTSLFIFISNLSPFMCSLGRSVELLVAALSLCTFSFQNDAPQDSTLLWSQKTSHAIWAVGFSLLSAGRCITQYHSGRRPLQWIK